MCSKVGCDQCWLSVVLSQSMAVLSYKSGHSLLLVFSPCVEQLSLSLCLCQDGMQRKNLHKLLVILPLNYVRQKSDPEKM